MLTIGEFSRLSRVSAKTLRYYDQIGLLKPGYVSRESGYRYYEVSQLHDMLLISRLKQYQFSLPEIAAVLAKKDNTYLAGLIHDKRDQLMSQISTEQHILLQMEQDIKKIGKVENIMQSIYLIKTVEFSPRISFRSDGRWAFRNLTRLSANYAAGWRNAISGQAVHSCPFTTTRNLTANARISRLESSSRKKAA
jgi:DNA-binding transcriptional MerR regulator